MLNDGYPVDRELLAVLRPGPNPAPRRSALLVLPDDRADSGGGRRLALARRRRVAVPPSLPSRARRHLRLPGARGHEPAADRYRYVHIRARAGAHHERSTAAHSTAEVDGASSTEVWGMFRAGRRARVSGLAARADASGIACEAIHDGFRHLPGRPLHRRRWTLTDSGLRIEDAITGRRPARGRHPLAPCGRLGRAARREYGAGQQLGRHVLARPSRSAARRSWPCGPDR